MDEDTTGRRLASALREAGHDVETAREASNLGRADSEQMACAAGTNRVILSSNARDFAKLQAAWATDGRQHPGIVVITDQQASPEVIAAKLLRVLEMRSPDAMANAIVYINGDPGQRVW